MLAPGFKKPNYATAGVLLRKIFPMKFVGEETVRHRTHILQLLVDYQLRS